MSSIEKTLSAKPKYVVGLVQAVGVALYVLLFVTFVMTVGNRLEHKIPDILAAMTFLMAFVTSALICGSLLLGYPIWIALQGRVKDAVSIVVWSIAWLVAIVVTCVIVGLTIGLIF